ncbi:hypothetical protein HZA97_07045 [Candidatus Woesearchaeota archaeon]|nr:hypothetical protein [Candidatus Woesearchaeota archaeon]
MKEENTQKLRLEDIANQTNHTTKSQESMLEPAVETATREYENHTLKQKFARVFAKTLEHATVFVPSEKVRNYLSDKLEYYDWDSFEKYKMGKRILNTKLVARHLKRGNILKAYESFWATWNPIAQTPIKEVYKVFGGNNHPIISTMSAFTYSGVIVHGLHPLMLPLYAASAVAGKPESIPESIGYITALYFTLGLPVAFSKWLKIRKTNKSGKTTEQQK